MLPDEYVFYKTESLEQELKSRAIIVEDEGVTNIMRLQDAVGLPYICRSRWITLQLHSSLEAVGLTATFSKALSDCKISCNVLAGYYHDHILAPSEQAMQAMHVLTELSN